MAIFPSIMSVSFLGEKSDSEMKSEAVHRSPGIYLKAEEIPGKPQLGDRQKKAMRLVINSNGIPYLQGRSVGSRTRQRRKARK